MTHHTSPSNPSSVFIDGMVFSLQRAGGISRYTAELICGLERQSKVTGIAPVVGTYKGVEANLAFGDLCKDVPTRSMHMAGMVIPFLDTLRVKDVSPKIMHSPYMHLPPRKKGRANILTLHDFIFLDQAPTMRGLLRRRLLSLAIQRADAFISVSEATAADFRRLYPKLIHKPVSIIHHGLGDGFLKAPPHTSESPSSARPFLLYVGPRAGYKSFWTFFTAFSKTRFHREFDIQCVGGGEFSEEEEAMASSLGLIKQIRHLSYVSEDTLVRLYSEAAALVYPSKREGFGFPIIEAMACGCPVITRPQSSMLEIGSTHAVYAKVLDPEHVEAALESAIHKKSPQGISDMKNHAQSFTWARSVEQHIQCYKSFL